MWWLAGVALFLAGCATVKDSARPRIAPVTTEKAVVYFIHDMPAVGVGAVFADGRRLVTLKDRMYTWFHVEPGDYRYALMPIDLSWKGQAAAASTLEVEAGKSYYVSVSWYPKPPPSFVEGILETLTEPIMGPKPYKAPGLIMLSERDAMRAMEKCRFVDPVERTRQ